MKYFVQFQTMSSGLAFENGKVIDVPKKKIDGVGSDSVYTLDGRLNLQSMKQKAIERMEQLKSIRTYVGYKIMRGESYNNCKEIFVSK